MTPSHVSEGGSLAKPQKLSEQLKRNWGDTMNDYAKNYKKNGLEYQIPARKLRDATEDIFRYIAGLEAAESVRLAEMVAKVEALPPWASSTKGDMEYKSPYISRAAVLNLLKASSSTVEGSK